MPTIEQKKQTDYHGCACAVPNVHRSWHGATGKFVEIRLCCMAEAVKQLAVAALIPGAEQIITVTDCEPEFVWNGQGEVKVGEVERTRKRKVRRGLKLVEEEYTETEEVKAKRGDPPEFLHQRLHNFGIKHTHEDGTAH